LTRNIWTDYFVSKSRALIISRRAEMLPGRIFYSSRVAIILLSLFLLAACNKKSIVDGEPDGPSISQYDWDAAWNGTANLIAYIHGEAFTNPNRYPNGVYVIDPDGSNRTAIYLSDWIYYIDWSPDGQWIVAYENGILFKISYPAGETDTLVHSGEFYSPAWSPDGNKIACVQRGGPTRGIYTLNADGSNYQLIIPYGDYPAWYSADSIVYLNWALEFPAGTICISDTSGSYKDVIVNGGLYGIVYFQHIRTHLQTKRIAALAYIPGGILSVWTYDIGQDTLRRFLDYADYPSFSPDGDSIIYSDIRDGYGNLNIICWDSTGWRQLTEPVGPGGLWALEFNFRVKRVIHHDG
jgi:hypothetical protein